MFHGYRYMMLLILICGLGFSTLYAQKMVKSKQGKVSLYKQKKVGDIVCEADFNDQMLLLKKDGSWALVKAQCGQGWVQMEKIEYLANRTGEKSMTLEGVDVVGWLDNPAAVFVLDAPSHSYNSISHSRQQAQYQAQYQANYHSQNTEEYQKIQENGWIDTKLDTRSTFSIDVDNASYSNVRRFITSGQLPPKDAVRIEELVNYFNYNYPAPKKERPFAVHTELSTAPWNSKHQLLHLGIQGKKLNYQERKPSNFVFLIDASGSMSSSNKLDLVKYSMKRMLRELGEEDRVAIVAYAGAAGLVLESTPANRSWTINRALDRLSAGGSTAGGQGINLAYDVAKHYFIEGGNNRVILATDGDFNVGVSSDSELVDLIEKRRDDGIYLTICGYGMGNYKDSKMEQISNAGNGNYFYIDSEKEAKKVFQKELLANMFTIAKDVKLQLEFNPNHIQAFRLIGYENRKLEHKDFNDDKKDAGELGPGHTVTALYEIVPAGVEYADSSSIDGLKYTKVVEKGKKASSAPSAELSEDPYADELMTLKIRYKAPGSDTSKLLEFVAKNNVVDFNNTTDAFRFSSAVAAYGMTLRDSKNLNSMTLEEVSEIAMGTVFAKQEEGSEFVELIDASDDLKNEKVSAKFPKFRN